MLKKYLSLIVALSLVFAVGALSVVADGNDTELIPIYSQGDINLDGNVNIKDVTLIQKHLAKITGISGLQLVLADVDGKEGVSIKDATHMQKWIAGLVSELFSPADTEEPDIKTIATNTASEGLTDASNSVADTDPAKTTESGSTEVATTATEETLPSFSEVITDPTEATVPVSTAEVTDSTEATEPSSSVLVTDPAETAKPTEATQSTTCDPDKPIELPFVPAH